MAVIAIPSSRRRCRRVCELLTVVARFVHSQSYLLLFGPFLVRGRGNLARHCSGGSFPVVGLLFRKCQGSGADATHITQLDGRRRRRRCCCCRRRPRPPFPPLYHYFLCSGCLQSLSRLADSAAQLSQLPTKSAEQKTRAHTRIECKRQSRATWQESPIPFVEKFWKWRISHSVKVHLCGFLSTRTDSHPAHRDAARLQWSAS